MNNSMDREDFKSLSIKKDGDFILRNSKGLDISLQGHFNIKNELYQTDNCNNGRSTETGTQIDLELLNTPVKMEPRGDVPLNPQPSVNNSDCAENLPVKQEVLIEKVKNSIPFEDFNSQYIPQQNHEAKPFIPYCDIISIKQELGDMNSQTLEVKNESIDINNDGEMIQMENGCTNSGCNSQTRCLHTYRCSKCNLVFTEKQIFATHLRTCRLNNSLPVPSSITTSTPHKTYEIEQNNPPQPLKKLIESIRTNPPLYDVNNEDYNDTQLIEVIWANIACNCGFSNGELAKAAWKKLKENFRDALTQQNNTHGHQSIIHNKVFKYQKQMEFLLPYLGNNIQSEENSVESTTIPRINSVEETPEDELSIIQLVSPAKKQKLLPTVNEPVNINSNKRTREGRKKIWNNLKEANVRSSTSTQPLHMFFLSMCETAKNLPPHLQLQVKRRVFQAVIEAEEAAATFNNDAITNNNPSNAPRTSSSSREDSYAVAQFSLDSLTNVIDNSSSSQED